MSPVSPSPAPELLTSGLSRRRLLKVAGVGGLLLAGGGWAWRLLRGFGPPAPGCLVFDEKEYEVVKALAEAVFPGPPETPLSAADARVAEFVDVYVSGLYEDTQGLFRTLLRGLDASTVLSHGGRYHRLTQAQRREVLEAWATSGVQLRRAGYQSLSFALNLGYYEDERVRAALNLTTGCEPAVQHGRPTLWTMVGRAG